MEDMDYVLKNALKGNTKEELLCGDTWIKIEHKDYPLGLFCQVELSEDKEDIFEIFCYEITSYNDEGYLVADYSESRIHFSFDTDKIKSLEKEMIDEKVVYPNSLEIGKLYECLNYSFANREDIFELRAFLSGSVNEGWAFKVEKKDDAGVYFYPYSDIDILPIAKARGF